MSDAAYTPRLRTGVVLCGSGTAGAYHAGVLRALVEAGIKIDVLAAHGAGAAVALAAAVDGGARHWEAGGPWSDPRLKHAYRWRPALRTAGWGLAAAAVLVLSPLVVLIWAALIYALSFLTALVSLPSASAHLVGVYERSVQMLFDPPILPTVVPRLLVLAVGVVLTVLVVAAARAAWEDPSRRRLGGAFWWRLVGAPLDATEPSTTMVEGLWRLVRGASSTPRPVPADIGRRYVELLTDNFGQPGFRELIIGVHDLDARRDLVGAVLPASTRAAFDARRAGAGPREAETVDFTGPARDLVVEFLQGALRLPVATAPQNAQFPSESFWRGERHRLCDRPEIAVRLVDELAAIGVEQIVLISPAAPPAGPHAMRARPLSLRGRIGEFVRSIETAALQDAATLASARFSGAFVVRPDHNPIGAFDFGGVYDESSDRRQTMAELMQRGYDDAYRQFIEPTVAAGEPVEVRT